MKARVIALLLLLLYSKSPTAFGAEVLLSEETKRNNLVSDLLEVSSISTPSEALQFNHSTEGWIWIATTWNGKGKVRILLDEPAGRELIIAPDTIRGPQLEAMRHLPKGRHTLTIEGENGYSLSRLLVRAIPELIHCGLGFNPAIKSYGLYDWDFLKSDILPNINTLVVPNNIVLAEDEINKWHRQGKRFIAEVGIYGQGQTSVEHAQYWRGFYQKAPFLDGIVINEFIVNNPLTPPISPERQQRLDRERSQYVLYDDAIRQLRADSRLTDKLLYAYVGGSGKRLNQEIVGTNILRTLINSGYRVALERYLHEMSSEQGSRDALQLLVDGIADWETREPGIKKQMVITFGTFSMPPGGLNKLPNVDYHVWMDQQMNAVANHPALAGIGGLEWWTSLQADEETVRFVGKLYRHYAIEGKTDLLTKDPLFLSHLQNSDFEKGTNGWTLHAAETGAINVRSFPRYGRIEGRFMGLGRPADPEHIGDSFLCLKRSAKGPNTFSQSIENLEPGRLYSLKMFSCDYDDLVNPKEKKIDEIKAGAGIDIDGAEIDTKRSFSEIYMSNPEPKIPVGITYYWKIFRAKTSKARLSVSDWKSAQEPGAPIGQEQAFNFLELQPYHE